MANSVAHAQTPVAMDRRDRVRKLISKSAPRHHFCRRPTIHVGPIEYDVGSHVRWLGSQHHLLGVNEIGSVKGGKFESVAMRDGVRGARLYAVSAKNTAVVVDVVNLGVALGATDTILGRVFGRLDVNAIRRAVCRA